MAIRLAAAAGFWLVAAVAVLGARTWTGQAVPPPSTGRSVLEGVFTDEQAARGHDVFANNCTQCHGTALQGGTEAPALVGAGFVANWTGKTVGDLVDRTRTSMPDGDPGSLTRQQYVDVIAFLLSSNRYPSGKTELPLESALQQRITIVAK